MLTLLFILCNKAKFIHRWPVQSQYVTKPPNKVAGPPMLFPPLGKNKPICIPPLYIAITSKPII